MRLRSAIFAAAALAVSAGSALAHEFWLEPVNYRVQPGERIVARAINGEEFRGREFSYSATGYRRSGVMAGGIDNPIPGNTGDRPAVSVEPAGPGLNILYHASTMNVLTYPGMEKFESFLRGKHLDWGVEAHRAKGLPEEGIREAYFRMVKSLVAVGNGAGADRKVGLAFELMALDNPYTSAGDIRIALMRSGKPVPNYPIYVFRKNGAEVSKLSLNTDGKGIVTVPRGPGGEFMVNAVELSEPSDRIKQAAKAHWQTLWAALTYEIAG